MTLKRVLPLVTRGIYYSPVHPVNKLNTLTSIQNDAICCFPWLNPYLLEPYLRNKAFSTKPEGPSWIEFAQNTGISFDNVQVPIYFKRLLTRQEFLTDINTIYTKFHQKIAIPDYGRLYDICEERFAIHIIMIANRLNSVGIAMGIEGANVELPKVEVLEFKLFNGLNLNRELNKPEDEYIKCTEFIRNLSHPCTFYKLKTQIGNQRLTMLSPNYKPYLIQVKFLVHSPLSFYCYSKNQTPPALERNQPNTNIIQLEVNVKDIELYNIIQDKGMLTFSKQFRITDFNNSFHGNPFFTKQ